jgi:RimJ/RimL family protein N-acetyltransferase
MRGRRQDVPKGSRARRLSVVGLHEETGDTSPRQLGVDVDPAEEIEYVTLPNQKRLRIRALRPSEEGPIRDLDTRLSRQTRYRRFFSAMSVLPDSLVQTLARVDHSHVSLVAEYDAADGRRIVALGSFGAVDEVCVEVALVVCDEWQGQRVGTELARRILAAAERRGFHRFIAHMLSDNVAIRRLLRQLGELVWAKTTGSVQELVFVRRSPSA